MPIVPAFYLKMQVDEVSRYEVFGDSGWRGSIRLVKVVWINQFSYLKTLPRTQNKQKNHQKVQILTKNPEN